MSLLNYYEYISEKIIFDMILESKLVYSQKLTAILGKMNRDKIARQLLALYNKNVDGLRYNYIDTTDEQDRVTFTPDRKVQEIIDKLPEVWVLRNGSSLTYSDRNNRLFTALGFDKTTQAHWSAEEGAVGTITGEATSNVTKKVYVLFQELGRPHRKTVVNKAYLVPNQDIEIPEVWTTSRNPISIGRLAGAILRSSNIAFVEKEMEDFVNLYKATFNFEKDALKRFDIVSGKKIKFWYNSDNYEKGGGSLNGSCMSYKSTQNFLSIYTDNKNVELVILYDDNGELAEDGKYTSKRIKGRALLWNNAEIDGEPGQKFMDRIYTKNDCDVELFKRLAHENGYWYKYHQSMDPTERITNGKLTKNATIKVELDESSFNKYPYMDTMCFIKNGKKTKWASNIGEGKNRYCKDTDGGYSNSNNGEDDD